MPYAPHRLWLDTPPLHAAAYAAPPSVSCPAEVDASSGGACSCENAQGPCACPAHAAAPEACAGRFGAVTDPSPDLKPGQEPSAWAAPAALQQAAALQGAAEHPGGAAGGAAGEPAGDPRWTEGGGGPLLARVAAGLLLVEAALPREALAPDWPGRDWRQVSAQLWDKLSKQGSPIHNVGRPTACDDMKKVLSTQTQQRAHLLQPRCLLPVLGCTAASAMLAACRPATRV